MSGINKVILVGRLGKEPDVRFTQDGKPIANITMATSETWKDKQGQKQEKTEWHRVVFFGGIAQVVADYVKKGSNIYIEGKLTTRKWTDQQGQDKYTTEIVVDGFNGVMQMLDSRESNNGQANTNQSQQGYAPQTSQNRQVKQPINQQNNDADAFDVIDNEIHF